MYNPCVRQLYLHVGYPKTGTSAIQAFLGANADVLEQLGLLVPKTGRATTTGAHPVLIRTLAGMPVSPKLAVHEADIIGELAQSKHHSVLISSEMLADLLRREGQAKPLLTKLRSTGLNIVALLYVRNQPQWINSSYAQRVRSFVHWKDFASHVDSAVNHSAYDPFKFYRLTTNYHLEVKARPFSIDVRRGGVAHDFLDSIGCTERGSFIFPGQVNQSVGPFTVEVARRLQEWLRGRAVGGLTFAQASACRNALIRTVRAHRITEPPYCGLDNQTAAKIAAAFRYNNDRFARAIWRTSWRSIFSYDLDCEFAPNDYRMIGVPPEMARPIEDVFATMQSKISSILSHAKLNPREPWNELPARVQSFADVS
jgi:hypothetical protein